MGRKISDGQSVKAVVPENTTIKQGDFCYLGGFLGLAVPGVVTGADEEAQAVLNIESGEYETSQTKEADLDSMVEGADIYFDDTEKYFTISPTTIYAGKITQGADEEGVIWFKLTPQLPVGTDAATLAASVGALESLDTTEKGTIVGAINEVKSVADNALDTQAAHQEDSIASEVAELVSDFNALLAKLQAAGLMADSE